MRAAGNALPTIASPLEGLQPLPTEAGVTKLQNLLKLPEAYSGVFNMATRGATVPFDLFKWVATLLLGAIGAVMWFYLSGLTGQITDLRKDIVDVRIETTKAIGAVEKQIAITNTKLEQFLDDARRRR